MTASSRALLVAFLAVVAGFVGSTVWVQRVARGIDQDTLLISRDAAPGIQVMSEVRAELRAIEVATLRALETGKDGEVRRQLGHLDELMNQALALPADTYEAVILGRMEGDVRAFGEAARRSLEKAQAGQPAQGRLILDQEGRPRADSAAAMAKDLVDYDANAAEVAAVRIEQSRHRANRLAYELDVLCVAIAVVAAWMVLRVLRQVHALQQDQRRLVERKAEELEQFAGRVAHDILSPLSAVGISLAIASKHAPAARDALTRGNSSLSRVRGIVDGLLEFARAGARPEPGAYAEVEPVLAGIREELEPFAKNCAATLEIEAAQQCAVRCSPGVLLSLVGNLLRNAIKYLGESPVREVSLRVRRKRGRVLFEVEDTGPGIPASLSDRVFEPYVRGPHTNAPGIGLGLATVKRLAESHGGTVGVRAGSHGGALFWFELPEVPVRPAESQKWDDSANPPAASDIV